MTHSRQLACAFLLVQCPIDLHNITKRLYNIYYIPLLISFNIMEAVILLFHQPKLFSMFSSFSFFFDLNHLALYYTHLESLESITVPLLLNNLCLDMFLYTFCIIRIIQYCACLLRLNLHIIVYFEDHIYDVLILEVSLINLYSQFEILSFLSENMQPCLHKIDVSKLLYKRHTSLSLVFFIPYGFQGTHSRYDLDVFCSFATQNLMRKPYLMYLWHISVFFGGIGDFT